MKRQLITAAKQHLGYLADTMIEVPRELTIAQLRTAVAKAVPEIDNIVTALDEYKASEISEESVRLMERLQTRWAGLVFARDEVLREEIVKAGRELKADLEALEASAQTRH